MLIAHIGMGKVGSSSIQATLAANREALARQGIVWPDSAQESGCNFQALARALRGDGDERPLRLLERTMQASGARHVAISSEFLWQVRADEAAALHHVLGGRPAKIVAFLRPYEDLVRSVYMQQTRTGGRLDFDQRLPTTLKGLGVRSVVSAWGGVFGVEALHIRHVETLPGGDVVGEFLRLLGAETTTAAVEANVTPHWAVCELSRAMFAYKKTRRQPEDRQALRSFLSRLDRAARDDLAIPDTPYLTAAQRRAMRERYRKDALWLHDAAGVPLPPEPDGDVAERPFLPSIERVPAAFLDLVDRYRKTDLKEQAPRLAKRFARLLADLRGA